MGNRPFSFAFSVYPSPVGFILVTKYQVYLVHVLYPFQGVRALEVYVPVLACRYAQAFISKGAYDCLFPYAYVRTSVYFQMCAYVYKKVSCV